MLNRDQFPHDDALGVAYPVPRIHAIGDWVILILTWIIVAGVSILAVSGVVFGALNQPTQLLYVVIPAIMFLTWLCLSHFARGKVGPEWRLGVHGIERGRGRLRRFASYDQVRAITMQEAAQPAHGRPDGRQGLHEMPIVGNAMLHVRLDRGSLSICLKVADSLECFESLRQLCPHAGAIDVAGNSLEPASPRIEDRDDPPLAKEWRRRGWSTVRAILAMPFGGALLVIGVLLLFPSAPVRGTIALVAKLAVVLAISAMIAAIHAFREAQRCRKAARRGGDQPS